MQLEANVYAFTTPTHDATIHCDSNKKSCTQPFFCLPVAGNSTTDTAGLLVERSSSQTWAGFSAHTTAGWERWWSTFWACRNIWAWFHREERVPLQTSKRREATRGVHLSLVLHHWTLHLWLPQGQHHSRIHYNCHCVAWWQNSLYCTVTDLEFWKAGFQYAIKARVAWVSRGMPPPPQEKCWISDLLRSFLVYSWGKLQNLDVTEKPSCCVWSPRN